MLTERDLLLDIIRNTPEKSVWNISSDSWDRIPNVFSKYISINDVYGWDIVIDQENREHLIRIIDIEEIYEKVVHQDIKYKGDIIFKSYDHMTGSYLRNSFPNYGDIMEKYQGEEIEVLELKPLN